MKIWENDNNEIYDNVHFSTESKERILDELMKKIDEEFVDEDINEEDNVDYTLKKRRNEKMKKKNLYGTMVRNVSVAAISIALSGALIFGALNHIKEKNVSGKSPAMGKETIEVTTDGVTKVLETTTEIESETETEAKTRTIEETKEVKESTYGDDKKINGLIDQFSIYEDTWKNVFSNGTGEVKYAMTDLDHNGNPEIIVATMEGSGHYTRMKIYELVDGEINERIQDDADPAISTMVYPDITQVDELATYYNEARYVYIAPDYTIVKDGGNVTNIESKCEFLLENGYFGCNVVATRESEGNEGVNSKYKDFNDNPITEEEFINCDQNKYTKDGYKYMTTKIKWTDLSEGNTELKDSYKTFLGRE
ncbi:MAG TPA: hypothetical protein DCW44_04880 [Eubacterium sp.]|nr:hypothetical protein [Eubacterium sp.]